ncbi:ABC transporter ATP-binding protein [Microbacterium sp. QXD-8]|uniref:ABC transporter ATP-binding protein n=1 Tax=Microbacterium psychrotolerans TaxID=3068321 RepID=A0ABU0YVQ0_9MICO|nr:ABC transporter ATP-binding protein [Microbacterium sp. QXD-8]MDQ7876382.1 ABC transporter ATP-binding protein [Microbacterium sp. QXD-8]
MSSLQAPTGSPLRLLLWQAARQPATLVGGVVFGVLWMLCQVIWPFLLGRAIDGGLAAGLQGVLPWCAALAVVAVAQALFAVLRHRMAVLNWLRSSLGVSRIIGYHSAETGAAIAADSSAGEVASTVANDALRVGEMFDVTARFSGGVVAYVAVGLISMLTSPALGLFVLLGMPVLVAVLSLFVRPLARRQAAWRREQGALTDLAADTVVGLRVLRGIGGEDQFVERYARRSGDLRRRAVDVARLGSWLDGLQILLPGLFVAAVVWFGARLVLAGEISPGELVTFYGYSVFLIVPLRTTVEASQAFARGFVATGRVLDVLRVQRAVQDPEDPQSAPPGSAEIVDVASGAVIAPGLFTALVDEDPDAAAEVATRLGRFDDRQHTIAPVLWGGVDHTRVPVQDVRRRIVVSDATPHLFTGRLRDGLDTQSIRAPERAPSPTARRARIDQALGVAAADDAVQALPGGLEEHVPERASVLSGGQRQRLSLARALLTDAEVLVLIEPTSALDANTEATIASRLHRARRGRTTVLVTASPLMLDRVDVIHVLRGGRVVGSGTHAELLRRDDAVGARYRRIVARTTSDAEPTAGEELDAPWTGSIDTLWARATETGAIRTAREEPGDE